MKKEKLIECVQFGILESFILTEESPAARQAKSLGMKYVGFGRYSDGTTTYKSDGTNLMPMEKGKEDSKKEKNFLEEFIKKCNAVAEEKKSGNALLQTMISMLPGRESGEHYGKLEVLEQILNSAIPHFNKFVLNALKNPKFRNTLLKKFLEKFEKDVGSKELLGEKPKFNKQSKNPVQPQTPKSPESLGAVNKPNVASTNPIM